MIAAAPLALLAFIVFGLMSLSGGHRGSVLSPRHGSLRAI
jgi:hypothetical protein